MIALAQSHPRTTMRASPKRDHISFSAIRTYQECPLRYWYRYIQGLPEPTVAATLLFGQALHRALQFHFEQLLSGNLTSDLDLLLAAFWDGWRPKEEQEVIFGAKEDLDSVGQLADRILRAFLASDWAEPQGTVIGIEEELRGEFIPGLPELLARVDLLVDTGAALVVTDFKTARCRWSDAGVEDAAGQLLMYGELVKRMADGRPVELQFAVMTKTKTPSLTLHPVGWDTAAIERTKLVVERVWRAIEGGHFYPNPSMTHCPNCPYRGPCRRWTG